MRINIDGADPVLLKRLRLFGLVAAGVAIVVVIAGLIDRYMVGRAVAHWTTEQTVPTVSVIKPIGEAGSNTLLLPGTLQAFYSEIGRASCRERV